MVEKQKQSFLSKYADSINKDEPVIYLKSGLPLLDLILDPGGLAVSGINEFFGPPSCGKTTLSLHFAKEVQKAGNHVFWVAAEPLSFHFEYAKGLGVQTTSPVMTVVTEQRVGTVWDMINKITMEDPKIKLVVIDSIAALLDAGQLEDEEDFNKQIAKKASVITELITRLASIASKRHFCLLLLNQTRTSMITRNNQLMVVGEDTPGGKAIKFFAIVRAAITQEGHKYEVSSPIKQDTERVPFGQSSTFTVIKSKQGFPFRSCCLSILYGDGFDYNYSIFANALDLKLIIAEGAYYDLAKWGGSRVQGLYGAYEFLKKVSTDPKAKEVASKLEGEVLDSMKKKWESRFK